jgi:phosphoribosylpyrophosphate synthetase
MRCWSGAHETVSNDFRSPNIVVTDSVSMDPAAPPPHLDICNVAPLLTTAIQRNHHDESLADLRASVYVRYP